VSRQLRYSQWDPDATLSCPGCDWTGKGHDDPWEEGVVVRCGGCDRLILTVAYPTIAETRAAAAAGNEGAQADLLSVNRREAFLGRASALELRRPQQLPDLVGTAWSIDWDLEESDGDRWTVLRHGDREIWRELALWEGHDRFAAVFAILRKRYGRGLTALRPTPRSELYLYGDTLTAPARIDRLNAALRGPTPESGKG